MACSSSRLGQGSGHSLGGWQCCHPWVLGRMSTNAISPATSAEPVIPSPANDHMSDACACVCHLADRWLKHPHVIKFRELFLTERHICIAMEFANGGNLFKQVRQGCGMLRLLQAYSPQCTAITQVREVQGRDLELSTLFPRGVWNADGLQLPPKFFLNLFGTAGLLRVLRRFIPNLPSL